MIQTRFGFDSLYFEISSEFEFWQMGFKRLPFGKRKTIKSIRVLQIIYRTPH